MNILGNNTAKLNEVIFENRNKTYGAYEIRSSYNDSILKSLLCLGSFVVVLFISILIYNHYTTPICIEQPNFIDVPSVETKIYSTEIELKPLTQPQQNTSAAAPKGTIATRIIDHAIETATTNLNNPVSGIGSATATGIDPLSTTESTVAITNTVTTISTIKVTKEEVVIAEEMPEFEGGVAGLMKFISQNISYPEVAKLIGKEGTVHVSFVVNETGIVENVKVIKGIGYGCDEEVVRVVNKMPKWKKVGKNAGQPVKVRFNIPVSFRLK